MTRCERMSLLDQVFQALDRGDSTKARMTLSAALDKAKRRAARRAQAAQRDYA